MHNYEAKPFGKSTKMQQINVVIHLVLMVINEANVQVLLYDFPVSLIHPRIISLYLNSTKRKLNEVIIAEDVLCSRLF